MDDALAPRHKQGAESNYYPVLILVVMDDALAQRKSLL